MVRFRTMLLAGTLLTATVCRPVPAAAQRPPGVPKLLQLVQEDAAAVIVHSPNLPPKDRKRLEKSSRILEDQAEARARGAKLNRGKVNHALSDMEKSLHSASVLAEDRRIAMQHIADLRTHTRERARPMRPIRPRRYPRRFP
jgi:hypothetical protein